MEKSVRAAQFAGRFYPQTKDELDQLFSYQLKVESNKIMVQLSVKKILGAVVPHAGYMYSGYHAIHVYQILQLSTQHYETVVIINPNHTGKGVGDFNVSGAYYWETPYGSIHQDLSFIENLNIETYDPAHEMEHSGEVQLPFLQKFLPQTFQIVMITMNHQNPESASILAKNIVRAVEATSRNILVLASSDFSHYETPENGFKKDQYLINQILQLNTKECYQQVQKNHITACGYGPIMTLIEYAKLCTKEPKAELLRRGHSGEVKPSGQVVDYASFLFYE